MSKNIVIQEGGVGRQFTTDKVETALVGSGSCLWVPDEDVSLGTKHITENGTYTAINDGVYGFSSVTVSISGTEKIIAGSTADGEPVITTIDAINDTISEIILGDYFIVTYDDGSIARIEDDNGNACTLIYDGERITGFDDAVGNRYTIALDSDGNIYQVFDPNGQACTLKDRNGDGKIDLISIGSVFHVDTDDLGDITIFDDSGIDVTDDFEGTTITGVDDDNDYWQADIDSDPNTGRTGTSIIPLTPATRPGSSISGIDSDGDESIASINENGEIVQKKIPSIIEIVTPPTKHEYVDGETIDYSGIVARLKLKSGEIFSDENYPNGIVPFSELLFTVEKADIDEVSDPTYTDGNGIVAQRLDFNNPVSIFNQDKFVACQITGEYFSNLDNQWYPATYAIPHWTPRVVYATKYNNGLYMYIDDGPVSAAYAIAYLYNGVWQGAGYTSDNFTDTFHAMWILNKSADNITAESTVNPHGKRLDTKIEIGGTQTIPFAWANPYNRGNALTATFEISVTQSESEE